ncbi:MAG: Acetoin:2,6-dichlorophenolindophenol oxidoreductase subunit alpha [Myxococcota bacterium]|nr:Acetoin:2,6-dichlorophenolindophenol oxidoreductase subunit alpha [Myxococcota bacterium]
MLLDSHTARAWYRQMRLIRVFEERAAQEYAKGHIGGFCHLYIGQEAVAVGAFAALQPQDHIITHYREHGHAIARGMDINGVMAELFGKATGVTGGRGGSMHLVDKDLHFWGGHAIVGGHLPIATGIAFGLKQQGGDGVVLCIFGDGASNIGMFHESLNLAAVWKLPVIFLCENNRYGMGTAVARASAVTNIRDKAQAYNIPGTDVDGQDPEAVYETMQNAVSHARAGKGPVLVEAETYRFVGHSMGDPERYRTKEERKEWQDHGDPINRFRRSLEERAIVTAEEFAGMDAEVDQQVEAAARFAHESPFPAGETLHRHIYVESAGGQP